MRIQTAPLWYTFTLFLLLVGVGNASLGDMLPDFKDCLQACKETNCDTNPTSIPLHRRMLFWDCPAECDYACQHVVTDKRLARDPPYMHPVYQFHGKWPFYRFLGIQEPFSVVFSLFNYLAHDWGMRQLRENIPSSYPLRRYYLRFGYVGLASWVFSMIFHTRDFNLTEKLDYFAAGANVLYGLYYAPIRIFRLERKEPRKQSVLRLCDNNVHVDVHHACPLSLALVLGLHLQHGSKRGCRNHIKFALERIQLCSISEDWADLGCLAWSLRCLGHHGYEFGVT